MDTPGGLSTEMDGSYLRPADQPLLRRPVSRSSLDMRAERKVVRRPVSANYSATAVPQTSAETDSRSHDGALVSAKIPIRKAIPRKSIGSTITVTPPLSSLPIPTMKEEKQPDTSSTSAEENYPIVVSSEDMPSAQMHASWAGAMPSFDNIYELPGWSGKDYFEQKVPAPSYESVVASTPRESVVSPTATVLTASTTNTTIFSPAPEAALTPSSTLDVAETKPNKARLSKPIVIPRVLHLNSGPASMCLPYYRAYPAVLKEYGISQDEFLEFMDNLNIHMAGHVGFQYINQAANVCNFAGNFDPTGIANAVGSAMQFGAGLGQLAYLKGPVAAKRSVLRHANRDMFQPVGLRAQVVNDKQLRRLLGLSADHPLTAELRPGWTVPTKKDLAEGKRSSCTTLGRIIFHLLPHVHDLVVDRETNESLILTASSHAKRLAATQVRNLQVSSEVQHQIWRGEALELYKKANETKDEKIKQKLLKRAESKDKEKAHVKHTSWLILRNLEDVGVDEDEVRGLVEDSFPVAVTADKTPQAIVRPISDKGSISSGLFDGT